MTATVSVASSRPDPSVLARIEAYVTEAMRRARIPGGAVALVAGGEPILLKGIGQTALRAGRPVTPDTLFQIGSLTKGLTAMAVLQLRDRGLIDLDAPVRQYLPWFTVAGDQPDRITVRHLLDQTSGLPNGAWKVGMDRPSLRTAVERLSTVKLLWAPGTKWMYSNMNYSTLGLLIETLSGQPYAAYIEENIVKPLGMAGFTTGPIGPDAARPHVKQLGRLTEIAVMDDPWAAPGGIGPGCSLTGLARWVSAQLVAAGSESHSGTVDAGLKGGGRYGLGWFNMDYFGSRLVFNHGGTAGFSSVICLLPDEGVGVAALFSCNAGMAMKLGLNLVRILKGQEPDQPDVFPDFGAVFAGVIKTLGVLGAVFFAGLILLLGLGLTLPGWLGWVLAAIAVLLWPLPIAVKRNMMMPLPMPMNVGPGGWPLDLVVAWWAFVLGLTGLALYGVVA